MYGAAGRGFANPEVRSCHTDLPSQSAFDVGVSKRRFIGKRVGASGTPAVAFLTMSAVAPPQTTAIRARPIARIALRGKPRAARVVTRAASESETVLFVTNDKGEFVRSGSTAATVAVAEKPTPVAEPEETAADRAASAQAWIDAAMPTAPKTSDESPAVNVSDAVANAADAQKWIDRWGGAGSKAVNPAAKDPVIRETLGASAVEKGALMKQWSVGKVVDKLLKRNPASEDENVLANLGKTEVEKSAIVRQFTMMDRLLGRNPAARNIETLGETDAEKADREAAQRCISCEPPR